MLKKGFTLVEMVIVVGIIALITGLSVTAYVNFLDSQRLNEAVEGTVSIIQKARAFTLASRGDTGGLSYSIHVEDNTSGNKIILYKGNDVYDISQKVEEFTLSSATAITKYSFNQDVSPTVGCKPDSQPTNKDFHFTRLTGEIQVRVGATGALGPLCKSGSNWITIRLKKNLTSDPKKVIVLYNSGLVEVGTDLPNLAPGDPSFETDACTTPHYFTAINVPSACGGSSPFQWDSTAGYIGSSSVKINGLTLGATESKARWLSRNDGVLVQAGQTYEASVVVKASGTNWSNGIALTFCTSAGSCSSSFAAFSTSFGNISSWTKYTTTQKFIPISPIPPAYPYARVEMRRNGSSSATLTGTLWGDIFTIKEVP